MGTISCKMNNDLPEIPSRFSCICVEKYPCNDEMKSRKKVFCLEDLTNCKMWPG